MKKNHLNESANKMKVLSGMINCKRVACIFYCFLILEDFCIFIFFLFLYNLSVLAYLPHPDSAAPVRSGNARGCRAKMLLLLLLLLQSCVPGL